jgi:hypothetical protein
MHIEARSVGVRGVNAFARRAAGALPWYEKGLARVPVGGEETGFSDALRLTEKIVDIILKTDVFAGHE